MKYYEATISLEDRNDTPNDWRKDNQSWDEKIQFLYETKYGCDVNIKIKNKEGEEIFQAHRFVLSMSSNVLEKIINSEVFKIPGDATIVFTNISPEVIDIFLNFVYTKNGKPQTSLHAIELYRIAAKLNVPDLKDIARKYIENNLDISSILEIIQKQTKEIINEHNVLMLDVYSLNAILEQPALNITEIELFRLVHKWMVCRKQNAIRAGCEDHEARKKLNNSLLARFCFLSMTAEEFCEGPMKTHLLRKADELAILGHISSKTCTIGFPAGFNRRQRTYLGKSDSPKRDEGKARKESPRKKSEISPIKLGLKTPSTYRIYKDGDTPPPTIGLQRIPSVMPPKFRELLPNGSPMRRSK
ncbi:uncharacterized protein LOC106665240 isoform X2 [Cimex lectularius]|uniref:BTB domain-containing protein n=1 Tax=Cimex lectularius TaxID=79782 RepID=A0A8I6RL83_CIMLE|nr:uncharacterized protein LOC106665240 isoform X2 [Cimex lectularius]